MTRLLGMGDKQCTCPYRPTGDVIACACLARATCCEPWPLDIFVMCLLAYLSLHVFELHRMYDLLHGLGAYPMPSGYVMIVSHVNSKIEKPLYIWNVHMPCTLWLMLQPPLSLLKNCEIFQKNLFQAQMLITFDLFIKIEMFPLKTCL